MRRPAMRAIYAVSMAAVVVVVDLLFFRGHPWERLAANVGLILIFVALYFMFRPHD